MRNHVAISKSRGLKAFRPTQRGTKNAPLPPRSYHPSLSRCNLAKEY